MRVQRGHRGCSKGAHQAVTDARISSMVRVRVKHVIDRGEGAQSIIVRRKKGGESR